MVGLIIFFIVVALIYDYDKGGEEALKRDGKYFVKCILRFLSSL